MMIILHEGFVKCKKPHICWYCRNRIEVGEKAFVQANVNSDGPQSCHCHEICKNHVDLFGEIDHVDGCYYEHETGNLEQIKKEVENGLR